MIRLPQFRLVKRLFSLSIAMFAIGTQVAWGDFNQLLDHTPQAANYLVLINAAQIYKSPIAVREQWQSGHEKGLAVGGFVLPAGIQRLVIASALDIEYLQPSWNAAIAEVKNTPDWQKLAVREHGLEDSIMGASAVRLPSDIYLVELGERIIGMMSPANRQRVSQWVGYRAGNSLSPYLRKAGGYVQDAHSDIVLSLDVNQSVSPQLIRSRLDNFETVKIPADKLENLAAVLSGIEGVTLGIAMGESPKGKIRFDFNADVESLAPLAKPIFLEVLSRHGASIQDFNSWQVSAKEKTIYLEGPLSEGGLRRILSLVELPRGDLRSPSAPQPQPSQSTSNLPPQPQSEESVARIASQSFFKSINKLLLDLRNERGNGNSYASQALWYDKYARKIDQLPMLNVDPDLLTYSSDITEQLRNAALAVRGVGIQGSTRAKQITPQLTGVVNSYNPYYGAGGFGYGWGYGASYSSTQFDIRDLYSERAAVRSQELAKGATTVRSILEQIDQETGSIRRKMTEKYKAEF